MKFIFFLLSLLTFSTSSKHIHLKPNNFVSLMGPITTSSVDNVIRNFYEPGIQNTLEKQKKIYFYVNSPGGSVHAGTNLIHFMHGLQKNNISIHCIGQNFMSMAFILFQVCDIRYILDNSVGMQHQMSFSLRGNIENMRNYFLLNDDINEDLIEMEIQRIGINYTDYKIKILQDWWIYGKHHIKENTADEIITFDCDKQLIHSFQNRIENFLGMEFEVKIPSCPLFQSIEISNKNVSQYYQLDKIQSDSIYRINQ